MQFIKQDRTYVWSDCDDSGNFTPEEVAQIKQDFAMYLQETPFDVYAEYDKIKETKMSKHSPASPLWAKFATNKNTTLTVDFDKSSGLKAQRMLMKDKAEDQVSTHRIDMNFVGALMCCDHPMDTMSFLLRTYCEEANVPFGKYMRLSSLLTEYAEHQMNIGFICKHSGNFARPSDFEVMEVGKNPNLTVDEASSVSDIPHPNHESCPSGHSTLAFACIKFISSLNTLNPEIYALPSEDWIQAAEQSGIARIVCGIHWHYDHEAARYNVDKYHDLIMNKLNLA